MIHLFINALAASAGGGLTYIRNIVPEIARRKDVKTTVLLDTGFRRQLPSFSNITFLARTSSSNVVLRFLREQRSVPELIHQCGADVLLSTGNFAVANPGVPQILLSRNALYTSHDFYSDLRSRGDHRLWLDTQFKGGLARWSIQAADLTVAPSEAFAADLRRWTGKPVLAIHHGFDREAFVRDPYPLLPDQQTKLDSTRDAFRLLFVSHYNYYRNFETLIRAVPWIKQRLAPRRVVLLLTCRLITGANPGAYRADSAARLVQELAVSDNIMELGAVEYRRLHHVYRAADCYITPAYAESFAHPLVEAMSSALPVVASSLSVHREICGLAALYFDRFSPQEIANRVAEIAGNRSLVKQLTIAGIERAQTFSWKSHVDQIIALARGLMSHLR